MARRNRILTTRSHHVPPPVSTPPFTHLLGSGSDGTQIGNAFVQRFLLLVGGDRFDDVAHDPVDHVLLGDATVHVLALDLVVQTLLDLTVRGHGPFAVRGLQLQGDVLLLGLHQQRLALGAPLLLLLVLDGLVQLGNVVLTALLPLALDSLRNGEVETS